MTLFQVFFGEFPRIFLKILFKEGLRMTSSLPVRIRDDRSKCLILTCIQIAGSTQLYWNLFPLTKFRQLLICFFFLFLENQQILKLAYDYQLNALIYFTVVGNGTMLIGIDDVTSGVQELGLLNSNDLPYDPLQITGIALDFCGK